MPTDINVIKTRLCSGGKEGKSKNEEGFSGELWLPPPQKNEALPLTQYCKRILPIFKSCRAEEAVGWRTRVQYYSRRSRVMSHPILFFFFQTESNFQGRSHAYEREAADITFLSELKIPKRKKGATLFPVYFIVFLSFHSKASYMLCICFLLICCCVAVASLCCWFCFCFALLVVAGFLLCFCFALVCFCFACALLVLLLSINCSLLLFGFALLLLRCCFVFALLQFLLLLLFLLLLQFSLLF